MIDVIDIDVPDAVEAAETVPVTVIGENVGEGVGNAELSVSIDGVVVATTDVLLASGTSETITLEITAPDDGGEYTVLAGADGESTETVLSVAEPEEEAPPTEDEPEETPEDDTVPGFGIAVAVLGVLLSVYVLQRRGR